MKAKLVIASILLVALPSFLWMYLLANSESMSHDGRLSICIIGGTLNMFLLVIAILVSMFAIHRMKETTPKGKIVP